MLERKGRRALAPFGALIYEPANNVYIHPEDTIYIYHEPQTYLAFGALGQQQQIPFGVWRLTMAEALAKAGGMLDMQADPASIFLFRGETRDIAQQLGVDVTAFQGPIVPIIYHINLRLPPGYFLATAFEMRNKDIVFVSNAASVESTKFLTYVNTVIQTVNGPIYTGINALTLKNFLQGGASTSTAIVTTPVPTVTAPSDIRLKCDITKLTQLDNGLSLYRFRYLWDDTFYVGVMAQEVERIVPEAVVRGSDGYLRVDYGRLGLQFVTWNEWLNANKGAAALSAARSAHELANASH
jgi:hypothetical protein